MIKDPLITHQMSPLKLSQNKHKMAHVPCTGKGGWDGYARRFSAGSLVCLSLNTSLYFLLLQANVLHTMASVVAWIKDSFPTSYLAQQVFLSQLSLKTSKNGLGWAKL